MLSTVTVVFLIGSFLSGLSSAPTNTGSRVIGYCLPWLSAWLGEPNLLFLQEVIGPIELSLCPVADQLFYAIDPYMSLILLWSTRFQPPGFKKYDAKKRDCSQTAEMQGRSGRLPGRFFDCARPLRHLTMYK